MSPETGALALCNFRLWLAELIQPISLYLVLRFDLVFPLYLKIPFCDLHLP